MGKLKIKITERILAGLLVLAMVVGLMPVTVFAKSNSNPDEFTISVRDSDGIVVSGADVTYTIKDGSSVVETGEGKTDENGYIVVANMDKYLDAITKVDGSTINISYVVSKTGYKKVETNNVPVLEVDGSIDVVLIDSIPLTAKVSVTKVGSGNVKINDAEIEGADTTVTKDSTIKLEITPVDIDGGKTYIKSLKIGENNITVGKYESYTSDTLKITEDTKVAVEFTTEFNVIASSGDGGTIKLNGNNVDKVVIEKGESVNISVTPDNGYQIASVLIDGNTETISDVSAFSKEITVSNNITVIATFTKLYTIKVTYDDKKGTVVTDPACIGGKVVVTEGQGILVTATPNMNYRVSKVVKNGELQEYAENNKTYEDNITKVNKDYTYEITFALNTYKVTSSKTTNGTVSIENSSVDYGQETKITLIPENDLYRIGKITIKTDSNPTGIELDKKAEDIYDEHDDGSSVVTLKNITENTEIEVVFEKVPVVEGDWKEKVFIEPSKGELVNSYTDKDGNEVYAYSKGSVVSIKALPSYDRVNIKFAEKSSYEGWRKEKEISSTYTIEGLKVKTRRWGNEETIKLNKKIIIVIDKTEPKVTLTTEEANSNGYYNKDIKVGIAAIDPDYYSGIKTVEYWVKSDGVETQHDLINVNQEATYNGNIIVDASKNNSDNVEVIVTVTDSSGNIKTEVKKLKINTTKPTISVSIDGTLHPEAKAGYYNVVRKATITIVDRKTSFDETAVLNGLSITAKGEKGNDIAISKSEMLSDWTHSGDTHTATITFKEDANYDWKLSYKNKADLTNDSITQAGNSIYKFTVDKGSPVGSIELEKNSWNSLVSVLTFGIWRNKSVSVEAKGEDSISPLYDIQYYKSNKETALSKEELSKLYDEGKFVIENYTVNPDEQFAVYARIADYAGNILYISTDGIIVDNTASNITLNPDTPNKSGLYNKDVNVDIEVNDSVTQDKAYSGIKTIDYFVENNGVVTQSGNLYKFDEINPTKDKLKKEWTGSIKVDASKNNDDDIKVTVISYDNAGVKSEKSIDLSINIDKPVVNLSFSDTANKVEEGRGYFGADRVATIEITDRASSFDKDIATSGIKINAVDAKGKIVELDTKSMISSWTSDENTHTATITFSDDGNYIWSFNYTNKADNEMREIKPIGTTPFKFTVDKTNPTGTISIDTNIWDKLLNALTFGLYNNSSVQVKATSEDATSPTKIEYYKTSNTIAMKAEELDKESFDSYKDFSITDDEQFVIYLKITDYSGNYIYINSDGYIVDKVKSNIILTPDKPNVNNSYNKDVNVAINVIDAEPYSGIKTVDYWIVKDNDTANPTQEGNLYKFTKTNPTQEELLKEWNGSIKVDAEKNNSCNVVVYVRTIDNAGNEDTKSIPLDIDVTAPKIKVTYNNNKDNNGNTYFNESRTATIAITERTHHFDANKATEGIVITAVDSKGNEVKLDASKDISSWETTEGTNADMATHTATIKYLKDANYTFKISYIDEADNVNSSIDTADSVAPYKFTVDKNKPTGTVKAVSEEGREVTWSELVDSLTFGFWSGKKITLTATSNDETSLIDSVKYYKTDEVKALSESKLKEITDWKTFDGFAVVPNEQATVYLKITDKAGNTTYISTDGIIADNISPREEAIAPEVTVTPQKPINGIYKEDVKVDIKVDDPLVGGTYSGLKTVSYKVLNMGKETQSGTLYSFTNNNPSHNELLKTWTGEITVDSKKNNSNDVVIEVYSEDNSLNSSKDKVSIKIDTTAPTIDIKYNNNNTDSEKYYKEDRVATVVITERNFRAEDVKIAITNTDGTLPTISEWKESIGSGNQDNTTHTATINYKADGDYTFKIGYSDLADNKCAGENYEIGTTNPKEFTIDKTSPQISVTYDNNRAQNDKYFNANRTATIVVKEHNFDVRRVEFTQKATKNGATIAIPSTRWNSNGDIHTATISYNADGDYTFDIKMKDMAGNNSLETNYGGSVAAKDFTIDTDISEPQITGVENGRAYKGDIVPVINFSDINYNNYEVRLTRTRMGEKNVDVTKEFIKTLNISGQGASGANDTFKKEQKNDGIYTLYVKVNDKAGNESEKTVTFTANRFGSVYEYSDYLVSLIANGGVYTKGIEKDLVITEYNADRLVGDSLVIQVTRDGNPIEGIKYNISPGISNQVEVGGSGWFQYQYTINKENFSKDGVYKVSIASKDATGNAPENANYKDKSITFRVDSTVPELTSVVGLEKDIINAKEVTVKYTAFDAIGLKSINVYVEGKQQGDAITDFSADMNNYSGDFVITENNAEKNVRIVIEDMAGNITDTDAEDFTSAYEFKKVVTVSTNTFVRWYANKLLFWSSIVGSLVLAAGIWYSIYGRRKKEVEEGK
ncbi:hypothetical protein E5347_16180 [Clostridium sartagoforme]|uniref:Ig-like domain-containing protein n=1 Tax=Clostridium sartagoforme TaxID=84031 RepID=A0A4S2DDG4_9CLOT|nr:hypothetical protein [Clostridium sartagoforme]TGY39936.1 hypothetical protein E5347_16180 [Clostridium sartagoforme]